MERSNRDDDDDKIWSVGVFDAHCHPTDILASINDIANMKAKVLTVMSTRSQDQHLVQAAAEKYAIQEKSDLSGNDLRYVIPAFGWHPWFSYQMIDDRGNEAEQNPIEHYKRVLNPTPDDLDFLKTLPPTKSLQEFLEETEKRLQEFPLSLVGEVGIDRSFRLPEGPIVPAGDTCSKTGGSKEDYTPGSREGRPLTPYRVNLEHQKVILRAQIELAARLRRAVSVHSVQAHGVVFDLLQSMWKGHERESKKKQKKNKTAPNAEGSWDTTEANSESVELPFPSRICMHSYSGPPDALKQFLNPSVPADIYFSFSTAINFSNPSLDKIRNVIKAVPNDRILVESDLHCAGKAMDDLLVDIVYKICEIKEWNIEQGAKQLKDNWERFVFGEA